MSQKNPDVVRHRKGCQQPMQLQNKLPDPLLQLGVVSGSWRFLQLNNPKRWENRANSVFSSATLPVPFGLGHGSRLWGSAAVELSPPSMKCRCLLKGVGSPKA